VIAARATVAPPTKFTFGTDALFDFDKSVLTSRGKQNLDKLVDATKGIDLEIAIVVGHTDSVGTDTYNMKLGTRRAGAVKAYMVSKGIPVGRVYVESKGERQPIADNKTSRGRAMNRRVEVEVIGKMK
jgi:OOP family OmpA-OmpF porin